MNRLSAALMLAALLAACGPRANRVDLGVDVYLQPQSGDADDLILQAAIRQKILVALPKNSGVVYVRVVDRIVYLSGSVRSEAVREQARTAAEKIDIRIDGTPLKPRAVNADGIAVGT